MSATTQPSPRVVFVGAGPGAADLITLRGAQALANAEVVLYDALIEGEMKRLAPQARWIFVGKRGYQASVRQDAIHALMLKHAQDGRRVVRLKGGDPGVFGRLEEEIAALIANGVEYEIVPGVTAALAAAAQAGLPLTRRGRGRNVCLMTVTTAKEASAAEEPSLPASSHQISRSATAWPATWAHRRCHSCKRACAVRAGQMTPPWWWSRMQVAPTPASPATPSTPCPPPACYTPAAPASSPWARPPRLLSH